METQVRDGYLKTIERMKEHISRLHKENGKLKKELGILEEEGFIEEPSLPLIKFGPTGKPYCEKHGAMLAYDHKIYRCEACKTAVQVQSLR